jgi:hypothetical protein
LTTTLIARRAPAPRLSAADVARLAALPSVMRVAASDAPAAVLGLYVAVGANSYYRLSVPIGTVGAVNRLRGVVEAQERAARVVVLSNYSLIEGTPHEATDRLFAQFREHGARVLLDYDDEIEDVPVHHRKPGRNLPSTLDACRKADALICTNETLAARLRRLNADVRVIPNYVRSDAWPAPAAPADGPAVLTLTGSPSHLEDWRVIAAPLRRIRRDYGTAVRVRVAGYVFPYLKSLVDEHLAWGGLPSYPAMLAGTTIGLCPLADTSFNRCKSAIKAYEFALSGAAVIGSPTQYGPVLSDGRGLVCQTASQWEAGIRHYLDNPDARAADAARLRGYVSTTCDARTHAAAIRGTYLA